MQERSSVHKLLRSQGRWGFQRCQREYALNPAGLYHEHGTHWNLLENAETRVKLIYIVLGIECVQNVIFQQFSNTTVTCSDPCAAYRQQTDFAPADNTSLKKFIKYGSSCNTRGRDAGCSQDRYEPPGDDPPAGQAGRVVGGM